MTCADVFNPGTRRPAASFKVEAEPDAVLLASGSNSVAKAKASLQGMQFFTLSSGKLHPTLPLLAPKIGALGTTSTAAIAVDIWDADEALQRTQAISLLFRESQACTQFLSSNLLSLEDLATFKEWTVKANEMRYSFAGVAVQRQHDEAAQRLFRGLVSAASLEGGGYQLTLTPESGEADEAVLTVGGLFEARGLLSNKTPFREVVPTWVFTKEGRDRLQAHVVVHHMKANIFRVPPETAVNQDTSTYQLLVLMQAHGWVVKFPPRRARKLPYVATASEEEANSVTAEKVWYLKPSQTTVSQHYLRALLEQPNHAQAVEHLRSDMYYKHILTGKPWSEEIAARRRRGGGCFLVYAEGSDPPAKRRRAVLGQPRARLQAQEKGSAKIPLHHLPLNL